MSQLHIFTSEPHHILASSDVHTFISSHHTSLHLYIFTYPPISFYVCLIHLHLLSFRHLHIFPSQLHISLYSSSLSGHPSSSFVLLLSLKLDDQALRNDLCETVAGHGRIMVGIVPILSSGSKALLCHRSVRVVFVFCKCRLLIAL